MNGFCVVPPATLTTISRCPNFAAISRTGFQHFRIAGIADDAKRTAPSVSTLASVSGTACS
jgi:hypothetical protein